MLGRRIKVKINYKSGHSETFRCTKFTFQYPGTTSWEGVRGRHFAVLNPEEVESVWQVTNWWWF